MTSRLSKKYFIFCLLAFTTPSFAHPVITPTTYQITVNKKRLGYLVASTHGGMEKNSTLSAEAINFLGNASTVFFEANSTKQAIEKAQTDFFNKNILQQWLKPETKHAISNFVEQKKLNTAGTATLIKGIDLSHPYIAVTMLLNAFCPAYNQRETIGVDELILNALQQKNIEIKFLETATDQLLVATQLNVEEWNNAIHESFLYIQNSRNCIGSKDTWNKVARGYREKDLDAVQAEIKAQYAGFTTLYRIYVDSLFKRNNLIAQKIEDALVAFEKKDMGYVVFVLGAVHLGSSDSVVQKLMEKGFVVTKN